SVTSAFYPRLVIHQEAAVTADEPMVFCEYADGANHLTGTDQVSKVPTLPAANTAMQTPRSMNIGGSLDCPGSTQVYPTNGTLTQIEVPAGSATDNAFYDVWATLTFQ